MIKNLKTDAKRRRRLGIKSPGGFGTGAERAQWAQWARRSVGNRKERLRDYASSPGDVGDNYDSDTDAKESPQ